MSTNEGGALPLLKHHRMDGRLNRFPRYAVSETVTRPNAEKPRQFKGFKTYDDRGTQRFVDPLPMEKGHRTVMASEQAFKKLVEQ